MRRERREPWRRRGRWRNGVKKVKKRPGDRVWKRLRERRAAEGERGRERGGRVQRELEWREVGGRRKLDGDEI